MAWEGEDAVCVLAVDEGKGKVGAAVFPLPLLPAALPALADHAQAFSACGCSLNQASASVPGWHERREET